MPSTFTPRPADTKAPVSCVWRKQTGKLVWKSGNDYAAYAGLMLGKLAGVEQVVYVTAANMKGYRAVDGKELWSVPVKTGAATNIVTPILQGDTVTVASTPSAPFKYVCGTAATARLRSRFGAIRM